MTDADFQKVSQSDNLLYGPRKLLLCGFAADIQAKFIKLLDMIGLSPLPLVWVTEYQAGMTVGELVQLEDSTGTGVSSELPRAIIMSGITQNELHILMAGCRKSGMQQLLWATLTPTSETWSIQNLLNELAAEHRAMQERKQP
ncbi:hypothetical protein D1BOALGB6SA_7849 [Olavius sp. associated proteobacterium Delta 1]|nr:hypothetical protein D1BOALGB6SA_7849 [Olavius sp. associated proteobacterium Delta 1]